MGGRERCHSSWIEFGNKGIGEDEIVMDELAIRTTRAIGDTPTEGLERAGEDLVNAMAVLETDFVGMDMVTEATSLDDGEETPTDIGFFRLGELDRGDAGREGTVQESPEAFADAGGIDEDVLGMPGFGQALELAEDGKMVLANPTVAGDDMIGGMTKKFKSGEVDLDDGEGSGIAAGIAEAEVRGMEGVEAGFVHAGDVEEEGAGPHPSLTPPPLS